MYHVVLLGWRDWQKDLGTGAWRELNRLRRGLQSRDWLWASREACGKGERKGRHRERQRGREGKEKGRNNKVNHRRNFTLIVRLLSRLETKPRIAVAFTSLTTRQSLL